jgi:hypothetical protein
MKRSFAALIQDHGLRQREKEFVKIYRNGEGYYYANKPLDDSDEALPGTYKEPEDAFCVVHRLNNKRN